MATRIDVHENEAFENGWYIASVAMIAIMALSVLAALTGILGGGPLARARAVLPHLPADIGYERFVRTQTPTRMDITINGALPAPTAEIHLDAAFLAARDVKDMLPHPVSARVEADGITYLFPLGSTRRGRVSLWLTPNTSGSAGGAVAIDGDAVPIHQFIYP